MSFIDTITESSGENYNNHYNYWSLMYGALIWTPQNQKLPRQITANNYRPKRAYFVNREHRYGHRPIKHNFTGNVSST